MMREFMSMVIDVAIGMGVVAVVAVVCEPVVVSFFRFVRATLGCMVEQVAALPRGVRKLWRVVRELDE
jgi:hypothetical protein